MAVASMGCWSNAAFGPPRGKKPFDPIGVGLHASARDDQGLRKPGVRVGERILEPRPFGRARPLVKTDETLDQLSSHRLDAAVTGESPQVLLDTEQSVSPGSRASEPEQLRERGVEDLAAEIALSRVDGPPDRGAQRPDRMPVAVLGTEILGPGPVEAHEIPEPAPTGVEGVKDERQVARRKAPNRLVIQRAGFFDQRHQQERPRVVVQAIAFGIVRHGEPRVLQQAGVVRQQTQVIELELRQLGRRAHRPERPRASRATLTVQRPLEALQVELADDGPSHAASVGGRASSHGQSLAFVAQEIDDGAGE
jgi:hypothetical protein